MMRAAMEPTWAKKKTKKKEASEREERVRRILNKDGAKEEKDQM